MAHRLEDGPSSVPGGWLGAYTSPDGLIQLVVDEEAYDFHIDAKEGYRAGFMRSILLVAAYEGYELLDENEGDPEILDDETIRIYLCPKPASIPALRVVA